MKGSGFSYGAVTIVNAIPSGRGCSMCIDLPLEAEVEFTSEPNIHFTNLGEACDDKLVRACLDVVFERFRVEGLGAKVVVRSQIPISRGLKSSSAASNALVLAASRALDREVSAEVVLDMATEASLRAGVSITGAYDDATASLLGGVTVTDNLSKALLSRFEVEEDLKVLIHVPPDRVEKTSLELKALRGARKLFDELVELALSKKFWAAMTFNGALYASLMGMDNRLSVEALKRGALCAGVSGTGPAVVAVIDSEALCEEIKELWYRFGGGTIITTRPRSEGVMAWSQ